VAIIAIVELSGATAGGVKMKDDISRILRDYMDKASPDQLKELADLLGRSRKKDTGIGSMAASTAAQISGQLKITDSMIKNTARNLVATLARQYKPDFTDREIEAIVNEMVPDRNKSFTPPPELLLAMIEHFIDYSKGRMTQEQVGELPSGWEKKYWESFGPQIRQAISDHLKGNTGENEFWRTIRVLLGK